MYLAGFLFRDQLILRGLIIGGDLIYIIYFFVAPATPLWGAIFWSSLFVTVNLCMIAAILVERMHFSLSASERKLFDILKDLTPGQFRTLLKAGRAETAQEPLVITVEGQNLDKLYFVLDGKMTIEKWGRQALTDPETFIGEIAFLLGRPATATVTLEAGCSFFVWDSETLRAILRAKPALNTSLVAAMNRNLANKVAKAGVIIGTIGMEQAGS